MTLYAPKSPEEPPRALVGTFGINVMAPAAPSRLLPPKAPAVIGLVALAVATSLSRRTRGQERERERQGELSGPR